MSKDIALSTAEIYSLHNKVWAKPCIQKLHSSSIQSVMITGAAGFLALHLIEYLSTLPEIKKIICVLRCKDKFFKQKEYYQLNFSHEKLNFIEKDVASLSIQDLVSVDKVIHAAAQIHALKNFKQLFNNNVQASFHFYDLCNDTQTPLMIISTLSVFVSSNITGVHEEKPVSVSHDHILYGGYAQTKWLTEYCVPQVPVTIVRLGLLTAHSEKAIFPPGEFFSAMIKNLQKVKLPPLTENACVDITPVNLAVLKLAKLILNKNNQENVTIKHIANQQSVSLKEIVNQLNLKTSYTQSQFKESVKILPRLEQLLMHYAINKKQSLKEFPEYFNVDLFQATNHTWSGENVLTLEDMNTQEVLKNYCTKLIID